MAIWKQLLWSVAVAFIALVIAAWLSPVASGFLAGHGLAVPLRMLGLVAAEGQAEGAGQQPQAGGRRDQPRKATVVLQPAGTAIINDKVTALGTGAALQSVVVLPKAGGTLTEITVARGRRWRRGR